MPRINRLRRRRDGVGLNPAEQLELVIGPFGASVFPSEEARREAYFAHKEHLLEENGRCWAWVTYEAGGFAEGEHGRVTQALARLDAGVTA